MSPRYTILSTQPTIYQDQARGVVNGVLVKFRLNDYNEVHEVRSPDLNVDTVKLSIEKVLADRDALASLGASAE